MLTHELAHAWVAANLDRVGYPTPWLSSSELHDVTIRELLGMRIARLESRRAERVQHVLGITVPDVRSTISF